MDLLKVELAFHAFLVDHIVLVLETSDKYSIAISKDSNFDSEALGFELAKIEYFMFILINMINFSFNLNFPLSC